LLSHIDLGSFLMIIARRFVLVIRPDYYVLDSGDSYSHFLSDVDQAVRLLFSDILELILLPMRLHLALSL
jgi:hypothetical protein